MSNKTLTVGLIAVAIIAIGGYFYPRVASLFGANNCDTYTCFTKLEVLNAFKNDGTAVFAGAMSLTSTFQLGSSGTVQSNQVVTTCNPIADASIAATSTGYIYCTGVTGVTSSDYVFASFSTSTVAIGTNWVILGAKASTTAGAIDIKIMNLTGTAAVPSASAGAQFASSTRIWAAH